MNQSINLSSRDILNNVNCNSEYYIFNFEKLNLFHFFNQFYSVHYINSLKFLFKRENGITKRKGNLPFAGSCPRWTQGLWLGQAKGMSLGLHPISQTALRSSTSAFSANQQTAESEVNQLIDEPSPTQDPEITGGRHTNALQDNLLFIKMDFLKQIFMQRNPYFSHQSTKELSCL